MSKSKRKSPGNGADDDVTLQSSPKKSKHEMTAPNDLSISKKSRDIGGKIGVPIGSLSKKEQHELKKKTKAARQDGTITQIVAEELAELETLPDTEKYLPSNIAHRLKQALLGEVKDKSPKGGAKDLSNTAPDTGLLLIFKSLFSSNLENKNLRQVYNSLFGADTAPLFAHGIRPKALGQLLAVLLDRLNDGGLEEHFVQALNSALPKVGEEPKSWSIKIALSVVQLICTTADAFTEPAVKRFLLHPTSDWPTKLLSILPRYAYFRPTSKKNVSQESLILPADRAVIKTRLRTSILYAVRADAHHGFQAVVGVVGGIRKLSASNTHETLLEADDDVLEELKGAHRMLVQLIRSLDSLRLKSQNDPDRASVKRVCAYILLIGTLLLQAYDQDTEAISDLHDLTNETKLEEENGVVGTFADTNDLIMSLMARGSTWLRSMAEQIFMLLAPSLTTKSMEGLWEILAQPENAAGQQELFERKDDDEMNEGDGDNSSDDDVEIVMDGDDSIDAHEDDEDDEDSDEGGDEEEDDDMDNDNDEELAKFDAMLAQTLKVPKPGEEDDDDEDEDSDADMDDDEMMALEPALVKVFQERRKALPSKSAKQQQKNAKRSVIEMKFRVLDLLEIHAKEVTPNFILRDRIPDLLALIRTSKDRSVTGRAHKVLRLIFGAAKNKGLPVHSDPTVKDASNLRDLLIEVHNEALQGESKQHAEACGQASIFVARCLLAADEDGGFESAVDRYNDTQKVWFRGGSKMVSSFFADWARWCDDMKKTGKYMRSV